MSSTLLLLLFPSHVCLSSYATQALIQPLNVKKGCKNKAKCFKLDGFSCFNQFTSGKKKGRARLGHRVRNCWQTRLAKTNSRPTPSVSKSYTSCTDPVFFFIFLFFHIRSCLCFFNVSQGSSPSLSEVINSAAFYFVSPCKVSAIHAAKQV